MYRVIAIVAAGLVLAACSTDSKNIFGIEPAKDTIRFESEPPGAEAKTSTGETCKTPCALAMPADKPFTVTFTLTGYQPDTEQLQLASAGDGTSKLSPNPVTVKLTAVPKPKRKVHRKKATAKPKPKPAPAAPAPAATTAPPPMTPTPQPQTTSPWPAAPPPPLPSR